MHEFDPNDEADFFGNLENMFSSGNSDGMTPPEESRDDFMVDEAFLRPPDASDDGPSAVFAEGSAAPPEAVQSWCENEVLSTLAGELATAQTDEGIYIGGTPYGQVLADVAEDAAAQDDGTNMETYLDMMERLPRVSDEDTVRVCYAGALVGNERAASILEDKLTLERTRLTLRLDDMHSEAQSGWQRTHDHPLLLSAVIAACEQYGVPAEPWIDQYGVNREQRWRLGVEYREHLVAAEPPREAAAPSPAQSALDVKAAELARDNTLRPVFVTEHAAEAFSKISDPELRYGVADRFLNVIDRMRPISYRLFDRCMQLGAAVMNDTELAGADLRHRFERAVLVMTDRLREDGVPENLLIRWKMPWQQTIKRLEGASAGDLIASLNSQLRGIADDLDTHSADYEPAEAEDRLDQGMRARDESLFSAAITSAYQGDFADTAQFIGAIGSQEEADVAIADCLALAKTADDIAAIAPPEGDLALVLNPALGLQVELANARVSGDITVMINKAQECVRTLHDNEQHEELKRGYIDEAYRAIAERDPAQALDFGRQVLAALREAGEDYPSMSGLSEALILAGDPDEPGLAYATIQQTAGDEDRLACLWQLGRRIAAARR